MRVGQCVDVICDGEVLEKRTIEAAGRRFLTDNKKERWCHDGSRYETHKEFMVRVKNTRSKKIELRWITPSLDVRELTPTQRIIQRELQEGFNQGYELPEECGVLLEQIQAVLERPDMVELGENPATWPST